MRPSRPEIDELDFGGMPSASDQSTTLGKQIESDGQNICRTIGSMDWSGKAREAAETRGERERTQFVRVGDAFDGLAGAIADGNAAMSHIAGRLKMRSVDYEAQTFTVTDDWTVTDAYDYAPAEEAAAGNPEALRQISAIKARRVEEAETATAILHRLAGEFDEADTRCAAAITSYAERIGALTPITSALSSGVGERISQKLADGNPLSPFERRLLDEGTRLSPEQLDALRHGKPAPVSQGQFDFLQEIAEDLDGKTMDQILALGGGPNHRSIQGGLANATQLLGNPKIRTAADERGGMSMLPGNVRNLLTSNLVERNPSAASRALVGAGPHVPNAREFGKLATFIGQGDENLRSGSDVNRGLLKQASELAAAGEAPRNGSGGSINAREYDQILNTALNVAAADKIAAHDFMTGANMNVTCTDGGQYNAGIHLNGLVSQEWSTDKSGLHRLFDWVGADAASGNRFDASMAHDAAGALGRYLGSPGDLGANGDLGIRNPELAQILAKTVSPYLGDYVGLGVFGADRLEPGELENIFRSLNTDGQAAATLNSAAFKWQNVMGTLYGMDTYNAHLAEYAGTLSQAMIDGNGHAVERLGDAQLTERMATYNKQMLLFGLTKDALPLIPGGALGSIAMQQQLADGLFGQPQRDPDAAVGGNDPNWIAQLNDPKVSQFHQFSGYVATHPELRAERPEWFDKNGQPDWNRLKHDERWANFMTGISARWEDDFDRGTKRPDWTGSPNNPKPEHPDAPAARP